MSFNAVIFDLDGTLLDTLEDLADSGNQVLARHDMPVHPVEKYRYFVGEGLQVLIERILPENQRTEAMIHQLAAEFKDVYSRNWQVKSRMYDGVEEMLTTLEKQSIRLAILSNKPHEFTRICVRQLLANHHFEQVFGARPGKPGKPDPAGALEIAGLLEIDPAEIVYLGDTATDMQTAVQAGMYPVGALWGFRTEDELVENGAVVVVSRPEQLSELF